jgi:hypothetical protein
VLKISVENAGRNPNLTSHISSLTVIVLLLS